MMSSFLVPNPNFWTTVYTRMLLCRGRGLARNSGPLINKSEKNIFALKSSGAMWMTEWEDATVEACLTALLTAFLQTRDTSHWSSINWKIDFEQKVLPIGWQDLAEMRDINTTSSSWVLGWIMSSSSVTFQFFSWEPSDMEASKPFQGSSYLNLSPEAVFCLFLLLSFGEKRRDIFELMYVLK